MPCDELAGVALGGALYFLGVFALLLQRNQRSESNYFRCFPMAMAKSRLYGCFLRFAVSLKTVGRRMCEAPGASAGYGQGGPKGQGDVATEGQEVRCVLYCTVRSSSSSSW